jgi:UDP-N-acetylglucosamine 2-epimerase (non-hydrolysing)
LNQNKFSDRKYKKMKAQLKVMTVVGTRPEIITIIKSNGRFDHSSNRTHYRTYRNYDYELKSDLRFEIFVSQIFFLNAAGATATEP